LAIIDLIMETVTSGDVKLRSFRLSDCERMTCLANNENISRNLRDGFPHPYTLAHAEAFIRKCMDQKPASVFAIEYKGEYVGNIGIMKCSDVYRKSAEVGYFLGEEYWGKGIATQALKLVCEYGFRELDIIRIHSGVYEHNLASQRVLEKCGFVKEGVFKMAVFKYDKYWNEVRYALINQPVI
jgi:[ribosomal protein S5]-alanine N-acetyltransferase